MQASQLATFSALTEVEVTAIAYTEAAGGDLDLALSFAVEDLLALEIRFAEALKAVSKGYIRGRLPEAKA